MDLQSAIAQWNGKSADDITAIYNELCAHPNFIQQVIQLISDSDSQKGVTWLLKHWFDEKNSLESKQVEQIYQQLPKLNHWESKLHILQSIPYMPITQQQKNAVEAFLRITLTDSNKFVRAWSYNGFHQLAMQHKEYTDEVKSFFEMAMKDEAASVKARIRNIIEANPL